jgi:hypothetical protein
MHACFGSIDGAVAAHSPPTALGDAAVGGQPAEFEGDHVVVIGE